VLSTGQRPRRGSSFSAPQLTARKPATTRCRPPVSYRTQRSGSEHLSRARLVHPFALIYSERSSKRCLIPILPGLCSLRPHRHCLLRQNLIHDDYPGHPPAAPLSAYLELRTQEAVTLVSLCRACAVPSLSGSFPAFRRIGYPPPGLAAGPSSRRSRPHDPLCHGHEGSLGLAGLLPLIGSARTHFDVVPAVLLLVQPVEEPL
jgi:hypothetical protein